MLVLVRAGAGAGAGSGAGAGAGAGALASFKKKKTLDCSPKWKGRGGANGRRVMEKDRPANEQNKGKSTKT